MVKAEMDLRALKLSRKLKNSDDWKSLAVLTSEG